MWHTIPALGTGLLTASLVASGFTFFLAALASSRPRLLAAARRAAYGTAAWTTAAVAILAYGFVTHDFRLSYVSRYSDRSMSVGYLISALWGGQDGSLLWWMFLLAAYSAVCVAWLRNRYLALQPYVIAALMGTVAFFGLVTLVAADPFTLNLAGPPVDGQGLNPLLQNINMVIHPPALYLGFVGCTIPYAFAMAALVSGRLDNEWLIAIRKWMLVAWLFLTLGNVLGMIWAYVELGWGGYWGWDPVENASLFPWITATAYIHSAMVQERRPMFKLWNISLVSITFFLTIFGTFLTRSGVIASVHAFAESDLGIYFLYFLGLLISTTIGLIVWRWSPLRSNTSIESVVSREAVFFSLNWVLIGTTTFVLVATTLPVLSNALVGRTITVGPEFYNRWMTPIGLVILAIMGATPLFGWRKTNAHAVRRGFIFPATIAVLGLLLHLVFGPSLGLPPFVSVTTEGDLEPLPGVLQYLGKIVPVVTVTLATFNVAVIVQEFWRGAKAQRSVRKTHLLSALFHAVSRARRRYGGYIAHLGLVLVFVGFLGQTWNASGQASLVPGETFSIENYVLRYERSRVERDRAKDMHIADLSVTDRTGAYRGTVSPAKYVYRSHRDQPTSEVDVLPSVRDDLYVVLGSLSLESHRAAIQVYVNPLVSFIWIGVIIVVLGTGICLWPHASMSRQRKTQRPDDGNGERKAALDVERKDAHAS